MTNRTLKYNKNGYDIIGYFSGVGEDRTAEIWSRPYGETDHVYCGTIYKGLTCSHGTERGCGDTWTTKNDGTGENYALKWFEAARKLKRYNGKLEPGWSSEYFFGKKYPGVKGVE